VGATKVHKTWVTVRRAKILSHELRTLVLLNLQPEKLVTPTRNPKSIFSVPGPQLLRIVVEIPITDGLCTHTHTRSRPRLIFPNIFSSAFASQALLSPPLAGGLAPWQSQGYDERESNAPKKPTRADSRSVAVSATPERNTSRDAVSIDVPRCDKRPKFVAKPTGASHLMKGRIPPSFLSSEKYCAPKNIALRKILH
jgi:hypothetical protein